MTWASTLTAIDKRTPCRSRRLTPRPIISGPQTAIVTGPAGEEIWTDKYGRVKVQFHWDREGQYDENSSCWVRVSHPWAGKGWGAVSIPRIGQEVIVEFLEGDPDRPIITGRVYNAESMPPYGLPAGAVQSGIKSNSTKGGGGYNEYVLDDTKGNELIREHGQYDKDSTIEHDLREHVLNDRHRDVKVNETVDIGQDQTFTIGNNQTGTVLVDKTLTIGSNHTETVGSNMTITVASMLTETVGINYAETVGAAMELTVGAIMVETIGVVEDAERRRQQERRCRRQLVRGRRRRQVAIGGQEPKRARRRRPLGDGHQRLFAAGQDGDDHGGRRNHDQSRQGHHQYEKERGYQDQRQQDLREGIGQCHC